MGRCHLGTEAREKGRGESLRKVLNSVQRNFAIVRFRFSVAGGRRLRAHFCRFGHGRSGHYFPVTLHHQQQRA